MTNMPDSAVKWYKMWLALFPESLDNSTMELYNGPKNLDRERGRNKIY